MSGSKVRIGFEVEFMIPFTYSEAGFTELRGRMSKDLGMQFGNTWPNWALKGDGSLDRVSQEDYTFRRNGVELVTPPLPITESLEWLEKIFNWIDANDGDTNYRCGLHMGASIDGVNLQDSLDKLKLIVIADDGAILEKFGRANHGYSRNHLKYIAEQEPKCLDSARAWISANRMSINVNNVPMKNYVEFRSMGGAGYHRMLPEIKASAYHYASALVAATKPTVAKNVYRAKLRSRLRIAA